MYHFVGVFYLKSGVLESYARFVHVSISSLHFCREERIKSFRVVPMVLRSLERDQTVSRDFALIERAFKTEPFLKIGFFLDWPWNWHHTWEISRQIPLDQPLPEDAVDDNMDDAQEDVDMIEADCDPDFDPTDFGNA